MDREINNVFANIEGFNCFACGPKHPFGLKLKFSFDSESSEVKSIFDPDILFAGFPGILHGGIQATILDELAFWGTYAKHKLTGLTFAIEIRYLKKCPVDRQLEGRAIVGDLKHRLVKSEAQIIDPVSSEIITEASVKYFIPDIDPYKIGT